MNENTNNEAVEAVGYTAIGACRTRTTKTGRTVTDRDVSILPRAKRYRIDAGRSYTSKGEWVTNYQVFLKLEDGDNHAWRSSANVATQYGISMPLAYATYEKAVAAAKKMKETWGHEKAEKKAKQSAPATVDGIKAAFSTMSEADKQSLLAALMAA